MFQVIVSDKSDNREKLDFYHIPFSFEKEGFLVEFSDRERGVSPGEWIYRTEVRDNVYLSYSPVAGYLNAWREKTPNGLKVGDLAQKVGQENAVPYEITSIPVAHNLVGIKGPLGAYSSRWQELEPFNRRFSDGEAAFLAYRGGL